MEALARIMFVGQLVEAGLLSLSDAMAVLVHCDTSPGDFVQQLAERGLEVSAESGTN